MPILNFTATIKINGVNPYVHVSAARAKALKSGWKKPMPVLLRINGKPESAWRINMMPVGTGSFYLYLHGEVRKASKTKVGERVEVEVQFDNDYKSGPPEMPTWFRSALKKDTPAKKGWDALIPSRQKEILRYLLNLKSPEARERNLEKTLQVLSGKKDRFMGRSWEEGK